MNKKIAIIGFGHMGGAIVRGAISSGILTAGDITVAEKLPANAKKAAELGLATVETASAAVENADMVILAVKPSDLADAAAEIKGSLAENAVIVSICAGKRLKTLEDLFGDRRAIIRVMPNTPALVGEGMAGICGNSAAGNEALGDVKAIFESFGKAEILPETLFDAVTAVSGSGPAYVYSFINALAKFAENSGMTGEQAKIFAAQTTLGAAKMVLSGGESPAELKKNICTPNGTTVEAVKVLDTKGFEDILIEAAAACAKRSEELGK